MAEDRRERLRERLTHPVVNPSFVPVMVDEDTLHVRAGPWTGPALTVEESDEEGALAELFSMLDGETHIDEVLGAFDESDHDAILGLFERMMRKHVVYDAGERPGERGWPQLVLTPEFREPNYENLAAADVLVVNAGRIGPGMAEDLVATGVGSVRFAQPLDGAARDVSHLADEPNFAAVEDGIDAAIADAQYVVYAADREYPDLAAAVNERAHETTTPWMVVERRGLDGLVGPTVFPGETGCYHCMTRRIEADLPADDDYRTFLDVLDGDEGPATAGLPSYSRMLAGYATVDLLHLLAYGRSFTAGRSLVVSFLDLSVEVDEVLKLPRCEVCGKRVGDDVERFVTVEDLAAATRLDRASGGE